MAQAMFPKPSPQSPPMFESRLVDRFSRTHPAMVPILYVPAAALLLWYGLGPQHIGPGPAAGLFVGGALTWTLTEYWLHRTFFHWQPGGRVGEWMHFVVHGVHHRWPRDRYRLVMPPAVSISLFWIFLGLFFLALGGRLVWPFHAGFVVGYMSYDLIHFYIHHFKPRSKMMRAVRRHHLIHHSPHAEHGGKYGVSSTLWDHVFRTY
jgi:sterol desaturase/sphingolipid hydroxylase (fatty acid hydroxylase superfamily)